MTPSPLPRLFENIKMIIFDMDGVMTDARIWYDEAGGWKRLFSVRDGWGVKRIIRKGFLTGVITASREEDVRVRVRVLGIQYFHEAAEEKLGPFKEILQKTGLMASEVAYIGDDLPDLPVLQVCGLAMTVPDAVNEVKLAAKYITQHRGGHGAVREVCDLLLLHGFYSQ